MFFLPPHVLSRGTFILKTQTRVRNDPETEDRVFWYFYKRLFFSLLLNLPSSLVSFFSYYYIEESYTVIINSLLLVLNS